jgi:dihydrolipoamide dehydrogenase
MKRSVEVAIIGAGTAGLAALALVRKSTDDFVLINAGAYGTTCARVGCMPSKALIEAAKALHALRYFRASGVIDHEPPAPRIDAVLAHVRRVRDDLVDGVLKLTEDLGERNVAGRARFVAPHALEVGKDTIEAGRIIVATGSRPIVPQAWRKLGPCVLTTDELFEQPSLPRRMAVVGMGAIGAEIAQALARLGLEVTGFDSGQEVAVLSDPEVNRIARSLLQAAFATHFGAPAELTASGDGVRVSAGSASVNADKVLVALGRRPNVDGLGLEHLGVELDARGLPPVDPATMRIGDLPVYFAGDATTYAPILHEAADEGWMAAFNAAGERIECFERRTPLRIVFTDPQIAVVGRRYADLPMDETVIGTRDLAGQGRLRMSGDDHGMIRIYAERATGRLVGAELCAPHAEHLAHFLALALEQRMTVGALLRVPYYHPTIEEALRTALRDAVRQLPGERPHDLALCERPRAAALG